MFKKTIIRLNPVTRKCLTMLLLLVLATNLSPSQSPVAAQSPSDCVSAPIQGPNPAHCSTDQNPESVSGAPKEKACELLAGVTQEDSVTDKDDESIVELFTPILNILAIIAGAIAVIFGVIGGIKYTTSGGNTEKTKAAKQTLVYAIVGLVVALFIPTILSLALSFIDDDS